MPEFAVEIVGTVEQIRERLGGFTGRRLRVTVCVESEEPIHDDDTVNLERQTGLDELVAESQKLGLY